MTEKGLMQWAKDLKHNPKVAEKFMSVKTVSDILSIAKKNGYEFSEEELKGLDLNSVAGGNSGDAKELVIDTGNIDVTVNPNIVANIAISTATATAEGATAQSNPTMTVLSNVSK